MARKSSVFPLALEMVAAATDVLRRMTVLLVCPFRSVCCRGVLSQLCKVRHPELQVLVELRHTPPTDLVLPSLEEHLVVRTEPQLALLEAA